MKVLRFCLIIVLCLIVSTGLVACSRSSAQKSAPDVSSSDEAAIQSSSDENAVTFTVTFYQDNGVTVIDSQTVAEGGRFALPTVNTSRNLLGYYKWVDGDWSDDYITLETFADPSFRTVTGDLKFKAKYEWTAISPA